VHIFKIYEKFMKICRKALTLSYMEKAV